MNQGSVILSLSKTNQFICFYIAEFCLINDFWGKYVLLYITHLLLFFSLNTFVWNPHNPNTQNEQSYFRVNLDIDRQWPHRICVRGLGTPLNMFHPEVFKWNLQLSSPHLNFNVPIYPKFRVIYLRLLMAEVESHIAVDFPLVKSEEMAVACICISLQVCHHISTRNRVNE